jgi:replicative DNA helicase
MDYQTLDCFRWEAPTVVPLEDNGLPPLPTGMKELDARIDGGLRLGEVYRLFGRPAAGKTTCAFTIARCVALGEDLDGHPLTNGHDRPHPVLYFSLELSKMHFVRQLFNCTRDTTDCGAVNGESDARVLAEPMVRDVARLSRAPIFVDETAPLDVCDIRSRSSSMKKRHGIELVIVDYLQICNCKESAHLGRHAEESALLLQLAQMARELRLPVIVVEQAGRNCGRLAKHDQHSPPTADDIQNSASISASSGRTLE